ncbi:MAG: phosphatidate cytidylyltransferase, partial [Acidimicrobiia bacterium]
MSDREQEQDEVTGSSDSAGGELPFGHDESDEEREEADIEVSSDPDAQTGVDVDDGSSHWQAMAGDGPEVREDEAEDEAEDDVSDFDEFTSTEYLRGTTQEYQGLAEEVEKASAAEWEQQAVAASLPGVESGLVGFGDVSGTESESEESYEAAEQAASSDLALRIGSALVIFGLFLGSLVLGGWWFTIFVILLMIVSVGEFYATLRTRGFRPLALFGLLGVALMGVGAHNVGPMAIAGWAGAATVATILFYSLTPRRNVLANTSVTILGLAWTGMLAFAILIAAGPHPVAHIVFLVIVIAGNDVGAYFVGRSFGRRRLAPNVSPNKSVEGLIGGLLLGGVI